MFGDEPYGNYNRIMLSHVLSGEESASAIFLNTLQWYRDNDITLHAGWRVVRIDRFAKLVHAVDSRTGDRSTTPYDVLIIATGSNSFLPAMGGLRTGSGEAGEPLKPGVFAFRTIDDTRAMVEYAQHEHHRRAVVIGGGLLGLEAARGLQSHGLQVDVVHAGGHLMNAQVGPQAGEILRQSVEQLGIEVHLRARTTAILGEEKVTGIWLLEHPAIDCDMVVVAAGIRPNVELAVTSGFTVERAIVVDDQMRTVEDDDAQVCNCNGVSKAALVHAVEGGCTSVGAVMDKTRAGKGCGSCKTLVCQIVEWAAGDAVQVDPSANWYVLGIGMDKPELMAAIREQGLRSVSAVFAALAPGGAEDAKSKMGLASLLDMMWNEQYIDEKDARFINDRVHANIQKDGTFSVVPQMKGGVTSVEQLRRIADVAEKHAIPMIKLTGGQRIDLLGVPKEKLPQVWADLDMPSGYAYGKSFRTVKTCVGKEFCRFGVGDSTRLGIDIESRFQGLTSPAKLKLAVSGCPRNCAESMVKDVGVVAIEGGRWEIYIGGAAGAHIRKGDVLATVDSPDEVITLTGRFMQYYRENAKWLERTYAFVPRIGLDKLRAVVVEDSEGIAARLDESMAQSVAAYRDPWQDGAEPVTPGQFRTALPLEVLPQVPVR